VIVTCIDSSALLRLVFAEGELLLPQQAMAAHPTVSALVPLEVPCAIEARVLRGEYPAAGRQAARDEAQQLLANLLVVRLTAAVCRATIEVAERHLVRTLDAIHIGTALVLARRQRRHGNTVRFCTADRRQAEVAEALLGAGRVDFVPPWH
jgi:predicted nucleic acid-binding protein